MKQSEGGWIIYHPMQGKIGWRKTLKAAQKAIKPGLYIVESKGYSPPPCGAYFEVHHEPGSGADTLEMVHCELPVGHKGLHCSTVETGKVKWRLEESE